MGKILCFGEPLVRISPQAFAKVSNGCPAHLYYGGSEINVARTLSGFGLTSKILTALPDNPLGDSFLGFLNESSIDTSAILRLGDRLGVYYLENGIGCRESQVIYDRKHTSIQEMTTDQLDLPSLFEGVSHFHFSGITLALGKEVQNNLIRLLEEAHKRGVLVSFDLNYRSKLISLEEAKQLFSTYAHYADYCFDIEPLMTDSDDQQLFDRRQASTQALIKRMQALKETFNLKAIFHTMRSIDELKQNQYQAFAYDGTFIASRRLHTQVLQRVGSGDAFVAGALYKLHQGANLSDLLNFAVAAATLKCTFEGDSLFVKTQMVDEVLKTHYDISR